MDILGEEHSFVTKMKNSNYVYKYKWTIQDFNMHNKSDGEFIMSPTFHTSCNDCYMKLYPDGFDSLYEYVSVSLHIKNNRDPTAKLLVNFAILNNKSEVMHTVTGECLNDHDSSDIGCIKFIKQDDLFDASRKLLIDNQLTVVCTITKLNMTEDHNIYDKIQLHEPNVKFNLSNVFKKVLSNKFLTDVTLVANGQELQAHKLILSARSSVFAAMLQNDMKEKESSRIEIDDVEADVLSKMLEYIYTDKVTEINDHIGDLLYVANKYDLEGLKQLCSHSIMSELTVKNFVQIFTLAESYCCDILKQQVLRFIVNNAREIIISSEFESWKKDLPSLVIDIIKGNA